MPAVTTHAPPSGRDRTRTRRPAVPDRTDRADRTDRRDRTPPAPQRPAGGRGVAVFVDLPTGAGAPTAAELVELADTLRELAQDLVPGAPTRTEVTLVDPPPAT